MQIAEPYTGAEVLQREIIEQFRHLPLLSGRVNMSAGEGAALSYRSAAIATCRMTSETASSLT